MPNVTICVKPQAKMQMKTSSPRPVPFFCHSLLSPAPKGPLKLVCGHSNPCEQTLLATSQTLGVFHSITASVPPPPPPPRSIDQITCLCSPGMGSGPCETENSVNPCIRRWFEEGCVRSGWAQSPLVPFILSPVGRDTTKGRLQSAASKSGTESGHGLLYRMKK